MIEVTREETEMPLPRQLARFNRRATNRVTGLIAGRAPGMAVVVHKGRRSGRLYETPVNAFKDDEGYKISLTYGQESDWVKNVLAEGGCEIRVRGHSVTATEPEVIHDPSLNWAPLGIRQLLTTMDAPHYLRLRVRD